MFLLVGGASYFIFNNYIKDAKADWWNDDWFFRKAIQITNNTTAENNVYITLTLDTSDITKFQTDCGDIRFIQSNGNSLPYFIVSGCGTSATLIHANFEVFNAGTQNINFYYGNQVADNGFVDSDFSAEASNYTIGTITQEEKGPSPALYLPFDEGFGTTVHDESSNRNDGIIAGATWKDESMCKSGKCLEFDGTGDYVEIADNPSLDLGEELTLEAWVKPISTNLSNQTIISKEETPNEPTKIFRSVGPGATSAIAVGTSNAMSIVGDRVTFQNALPDNVGVGDAIQYDVDGDDDIDASDKIVFIHERLHSKEYIVKTSTGGLPTAVNADNNWSLFRAYISLNNAEAGIENTGIDADLRNFDDWTAGGDSTTSDLGKDIVASNEEWNIVCYANGTTADTVAVTITGWTTGKNNFISIYTPANSNEVSTSQRHNGKWDNNKYHLDITSVGGRAFLIYESFVNFDGLQVLLIANNTNGANAFETMSLDLSSGSGLIFSNNIINATLTGTAQNSRAINQTTTGAISFIYNNIIYNFVNSTYGNVGIQNSGIAYVYNNTVAKTARCYIGGASGDTILKNNIAQDCLSSYDYSGTLNTTVSTNNLSNLTGAPGLNPLNSKTVSFISTTAGSEDFHLSPTDTAAKDAGTSLASDSAFPFATDMDGQSRPIPNTKYQIQNTTWDIGADEAQATQIYRSVAPSKTDALEVGTNNSLTIVGNTASFAKAMAAEVGVGDAIQYDDDNDGDIDASDSLAFITGIISNFKFQIQLAVYPHR
jgi:hypothetical protein